MTLASSVVFVIGCILFAFIPVRGNAHCDTLDGPAVIDGRKALETGNINYAYKWIFEEYEEELK